MRIYFALLIYSVLKYLSAALLWYLEHSVLTQSKTPVYYVDILFLAYWAFCLIERKIVYHYSC